MNRCRKAALALGAIALLFGCGAQPLGEDIPERSFQFPVGLAVHPQGFALVASSNFDLRYAGGSLRAIDLNRLAARLDAGAPAGEPFTDLIDDDQAVGLPPFAGEVHISPDGALATVTLRQTNELALIDLRVLSAGGQASLELSCWSATRPAGKFPLCEGGRHLVPLSGIDPFASMFLPATAGFPYEVLVGFLRSGDLDRVQIPDRAQGQDPPRVAYSLSTFARGVNAFARSPVSGRTYLTDRYRGANANAIYFFDPSAGSSAAVGVLNLFSLLMGSETRGADFLADGTTLGVLVRNPNLILFLDTRLDLDGNPANTYQGSEVLGHGPTRLRRNGDFLYVTATEDDALYVVHAPSRRLYAVREDVCRGPFEVDFWNEAGRQWALISCFEEDVVAVLDADPASPSFLDTLARVGQRRPEE